MDDLTARRVMVTAAADGIGLVIAQAFAMRGASVHICDADAEALAKLKITLPAVIATVVDLADADATRAWCATSIASLGGVDVLIKSVQDNGVQPNTNVYAELGSTWRNIMSDPTQAAHLLGKLLKYCGEDNVLWGTDCIWTGSPQPQIAAFRAFKIDPQFAA